MTDVPLSPHLEQFIREQLAKGRFHSESEIIRAALHLLEEQSILYETSRRGRTPNTRKRLGDSTPEPGTSQFWNGLREALRADPMHDHDPSGVPAVRRNPRGILSDLRSNISPDEIKEAREEMWAGFQRGGA